MRDIEEALAIYELTSSISSFDQIKEKILAPLAEYLESETSCFLQFNAVADAASCIGRNATWNVPQRSHSDYLSHYYQIDPATQLKILGRQPTTSVFCTSDVCDYSQLVRGEFYNEFFRPTNIHHVLVMTMKSFAPDPNHLVLGFHRPKSRSAFTEKQRRKALQAVGVVGSALRSLVLQENLNLRAQAIEELEQMHPETGVALFDDQVCLVYSNSRALDDLQLAGAEGSTGPGAAVEKVRSAISRLKASKGASTPVEVPLSDDCGRIATVRLKVDPAGQRIFAVHTFSPQRDRVLLRRCADFSMTEREVEIIRLVSGGLSNMEIAAHLFISPRTVENHLRSIFSKAGVNRRTQLLNRLTA